MPVQGDTGIGAIMSQSFMGGLGLTAHAAFGVRVGDRVLFCRDHSEHPSTDAAPHFEQVVSLDNHIMQISGDLSDRPITVTLTRPT